MILLLLLVSLALADKPVPSPTPTPTAKAWPVSCGEQKIYQTNCWSTGLYCGDPYWQKGIFVSPPNCNTITCLYTCGNTQFWMVKP